MTIKSNMLHNNFSYADRYLAAQNPDVLSERVNSVVDDNDEDYTWEKGKKLSFETNKRRRRQQLKAKKEADAEEKRREEILAKRREKLKEATDRYQKCRSTKKAVEKRSRSNSAQHGPTYSNRELEETLKLLQGYGGSDLALNKTELKQHIYSQPDNAFVEKYSENNPSIKRANKIKKSVGYPQVDLHSGNKKTLFEKQLEDYQIKKWENQQQSMKEFGDIINSTLRTDFGADVNVTDEPLYNFEAPAEDEQNILEDSLDQDTARTYIKEAEIPMQNHVVLPVSNNLERHEIVPPIEVFESFDAASAFKPELFTKPVRQPSPTPPAPLPRSVVHPYNTPKPPPPKESPKTVTIPHTRHLPADTEAQAEDTAHLDGASDTEDDIETEVLEDDRPKGILKKQVENFTINTEAKRPVAIIATKELLNERKASALRDSIEISKVQLSQKPESPKAQNSKKSVRFAEKLCHEHEHTGHIFEYDPHVEEEDNQKVKSSRSKNQGRILSGNKKTKPKLEPDFTAEGVKFDIPVSTAEHAKSNNTENPTPSSENDYSLSLQNNQHSNNNRKKDTIEVIVPTSTDVEENNANASSAKVVSELGKDLQQPKAAVMAHIDMSNTPGYADLAKKPPKVYKPKNRPPKITSSTLNRLVTQQSPTPSSPSSPAGTYPKNFFRAGSNPVLNSPTTINPPLQFSGNVNQSKNSASGGSFMPKRTVSDPNLHRRSEEAANYNSANQDLTMERQLSLDKTPTDQEIDWLWSKVRECLNRSTSSIATESDLSIQSAPMNKANVSNQLIDGSHFARIGSARGGAIGFPPRASSAGRAGMRVVHHHHSISSHHRRVTLLKQRDPGSRIPLPARDGSQSQMQSNGDSSAEHHKSVHPTQVLVTPPKEHLRVVNDPKPAGLTCVSESLAEFLSNEMAVQSVDNSAASSPRSFSQSVLSPNSVKALSVRRGTMLKQREKEAPLSLQPHPPPPRAAVDAPSRTGSAQLRQQAPSQISLEEQRLMKSLERLNDRLKVSETK